MGSTAANPTRVHKDVHAAAKVAAALTGRTVAEQLSHWARIGSEVEATALIELHGRRRSSQELLAGRDYDTLSGDEQALVRRAWDEESEERLDALDLAAERRAGGWATVTLDDQDRVVLHHPDGRVEQR
jgi:hypothetical protein